MTESPHKTASPKAPHWQKGWDAETRVAAYLQEKGYAILAHRLKTPFGEIDVLAGMPDMLVVVEVKARKTVTTGLEAISPKQQQRLADAISWFIAQNPMYNNHAIRFDCVVVVPNTPLMHVENAWF